jgi:transcription initiation factor IIE alpha subunit
MRTDYVIECYFACPRCGEILFFDDVEAADKLLKGQPIEGDGIYPED